MAELLKRTFPIPAGAIICCGQCNAELWKAKQSIQADTLIGATLFESHIRPAPQAKDEIVCPSCRAAMVGPNHALRWKLPTRFP